MDRRLAHNGLFLGIPSLALLIPSFALGAPNDAAAQRLRDQAIDVDYLAANYAAAEKKLNLALSLCEVASNCSPFMRARLHCDLGVVQLMLHKVDLARTEFATALVEDPNVMLDPNLSSTDMQREFAAVKNGSPAPVGAVRAAARIAPAGIVHAPPSGQAVSTPLPLYAEVPRDLAATKVTIRYKPVSGKDWKTISMLPTGAGYGAEIPCADVGNQEGELQYFIQVHDANGDLVATSGRSATPHAVVIVKRLSGEPPHLPGQPPPQACQTGLAAEATGAVTAEASDCPPAFPGCHNEEARYCESRDDCVAGEECIERTCRRGSAHEELAYKKNWVSLGVQAELMLMPGADDACLGDRHYTCFLSSSGAYSPDIPVQGIDDQVIAGFAGAPTFRVLVGYDRAVGPNLTVGGRLGYAFLGGGPQRPAHNGTPAGPSFMPVHLEARLAYFFGRNVLAHVGPRFFVGIAGGMTEIDASESIDMVSKATPTVRTPVDAWTKTGLGFAAVGPGLMYALTPNSGPVLETKAIVLFPTAGVALAAQLGYELGF